jgi:helix-turn-helix, Psq domain
VRKTSVESPDNKNSKIATALAAVNNGTMTYGQASKLYCIAKSTIFRHRTRKDLKRQGRQPVFDEAFERKLAEYFHLLDDHQFEVNIKDIRKLAYQLCTRKGIPNKYSDSMMVGRSWVEGYLSRPAGKEIARRQPGCERMAPRSLTKERCDKFFDILTKIVETNQLDASRIYNVDETSYSLVRMKYVRVVPTKRKRSVAKQIQAPEESATVLCCMNAARNWHVKPFLVFKEANITTFHGRGLIEGRDVYAA